MERAADRANDKARSRGVEEIVESARLWNREDRVRQRWLAGILAATAMSAGLAAQGRRIPSPPGTAATEIRNKRNVADEVIPGSGKWIEITYGRPIKRGRNLWGSGADYGEMLNDGAPVWRAGANMSTRLKTEVPMAVGGKTVDPGE